MANAAPGAVVPSCRRPEAPPPRRGSQGLGFAAVLVALLAAAGLGDQIVVPPDNYAGVEVLGLRDGELRLRDNAGQTAAVPLGKVQMIIVDRAPFAEDFNEAEALLAKGDAEKAAARHERALRLSANFWSDVIVARLVVAQDRAQHLDEAVDYFIRLATSEFGGPQTAAYLFPANTPPTRNTRYTRAIHVLDTSLGMKLTDGQRLVLELLRYDLFRRLDDQRQGEAAKRVAALSIPAYMATSPVCTILASALETALPVGDDPAGFAALDQGIERCPDENLAALLLVKGDVLLRRAKTRDEIIRASWPYLRIAIHLPQDPHAPQALLRAAEAVQRIGNQDRAQMLLAECVAHPKATEEIKRAAQELGAGAVGKKEDR